MIKKYFKNHIIFLLLLIIFADCTSSENDSSSVKLPEKVQGFDNVNAFPIDTKPKKQISLQKDQVYSASDKVMFQNMGSFSVDAQGRVYIAAEHSVKVFGSDGSYKTTLGREGRGPGEFQNFGILIPKIKNNRLYVYDDSQKVINVFNLSAMEFSHTISLNNLKKTKEALKGASLENYHIIKGQHILAGFKSYVADESAKKKEIIYYRINSNGKVVSNPILKQRYVGFYNGIGKPGPIRIAADIPFLNASSRSSLLEVDGTGNIYSSWSQEFLIKIMNNKGRYLRTIYYPFKNRPLNENKIIDSYRGNPRFLKRAKQVDYPESWPALNYFIVDDQQRIWVCTIIDSDKDYLWWVLDNKGKLIAKFRWAGQRLKRNKKPHQIRMVKNNHLYTLQKDSLSGKNVVVRYDINLSKE